MRALQVMQSKLGADGLPFWLAFYDPLTQLPNRRLLRERLQLALNASARNQVYGALLMLDLDNFKTINDGMGHQVGDDLLVQAARRIQGCLRQTDTVARLGGDEFVVVLEGWMPTSAWQRCRLRALARRFCTPFVNPLVGWTAARENGQHRH